MAIKTKIESLDHQGRGISRIDGKIVFIPNSLPSEEVMIEIIQDKKNYSIGKVTNYLKTSEKRIDPKCPYYEKCGGCHLSHINYDNQLNYKKETLINIIKKYTEIDINPKIIPSDFEYGYRNKITLKIVDGKWGYFKEDSHQLVAIKNCLLANEPINKVIENKDLFYFKNGEIIIRNNDNDEILISIKTKDKIDVNLDELKRVIKLVGIVINDKLVYGKHHFIQDVNNKRYQVNYDSFFQINLKILSEVFKILSKKEYNKVIDLYCGVGTLGLGIKSQKLYGIETSKSSVENALINNKLNVQNNIYLQGDSSKIKEIDEKVDTIIIDPPRSGINKETLNHIIDKAPKEMIYMSCNPMTLARDIKLLKDDYKLYETFLVDMFPQTYHIECLVIMSKKEG